MAKIKDTDYVFLSSAVNAMSVRLLSREDTERMLTSRSTDAAARILEEKGYHDMMGLDSVELEKKLNANRAAIYADLEALAPDPNIIRLFRTRYDYHNAKVTVKAAAQGIDGSRMFSDMGIYPVEALREAVMTGECDALPTGFAEALLAARDRLAQTGDPQLSDLVLDRAYCADIANAAKTSGSEFLLGYVRAVTDSTNLRTVVRVCRQGRKLTSLRELLFEGGTVEPQEIISRLVSGDGVEQIFAGTACSRAAAVGAETVRGGRITELERQCDNAITAYCRDFGTAGFGEQSLIGYLHALDLNITTVRIIMTGIHAGLSTEQIRERLRDIQ